MAHRSFTDTFSLEKVFYDAPSFGQRRRAEGAATTAFLIHDSLFMIYDS